VGALDLDQLRRFGEAAVIALLAKREVGSTEALIP